MIPEVEEFAEMLIKWVRDEAIRSNDVALRPTTENPVAQRWRAAAIKGDPTALARVIIPDVVDDTIFYLLQAIDEGLITLSYTSSTGRAVNLTKEGNSELAGWYMGSDAWRERYSHERFFDDLSDLR